MKLLDRVYIVGQFKGQDRVPGVVLEVFAKHVIVDTIVGGTWKVLKEYVELMPLPQGILVPKHTLSERELRQLKKAWKAQSFSKKWRTPIIL